MKSLNSNYWVGIAKRMSMESTKAVVMIVATRMKIIEVEVMIMMTVKVMMIIIKMEMEKMLVRTEDNGK